MIYDTFEEYLKSEHGVKSLDTSILKNNEQLVYLKNRMWWAFHAGQGTLDCSANELLKAVIRREILPKDLSEEIEKYVKLNPDKIKKK